MFLRGYTTRINRLPTLRSSMLTKLAIVSSFTYCFLQKYIFDRRLFQIILSLMHSEYEEIVSIVPPIPRRSTRKSMILHHVYSSFSFLFFLLFFSSPNFFYSFFFIFFCFKSLADIAEGYAYPGDLYGKGRWMQLDPRQIRSFLLRLYERVTQSPPSLPPRSR